MLNKNSVHLQKLPNLDEYVVDEKLIDTMDKVRAICSLALSIRDKNNLRVRLPLNKITVISNENNNLKEYSSIIVDEINVKNIEFLDNVNSFATKKITLNFSKIGSKVGSKMPELIKASKNGDWEITDDGKLKIASFELEKDEYNNSWEGKEENVFAVDNYDILVKLDLNITKDLEIEGLSRDVVRIIQQYRKDAKLLISDRINLFIRTDDSLLLEAINKHKDYICEQTLAKNLDVNNSSWDNIDFSFSTDINNSTVKIGFNVLK